MTAIADLYDLTTARALTVMQPWAHSIAHQGKTVENRGWSTRWRGPLLIHAGRQYDDLAWSAIPYYLMFGLRLRAGDVARGAVIAVARLHDVCTSSRDDPIVCECGMWALPYSIHWQLDTVTPLPDPVPCCGRLSLWTPAPEVLAAIAEQEV